MLAFERNIPMSGEGSSTIRRMQGEKGLEPDESYYIQNEHLVRERRELDFSVDPPPDLALPDWWADLDAGRPVVHVSQGTIANARPDLIAPAIEGLAAEDVLVVVSTGGRSIESLKLGKLPANVRISTFLPYPQLLPKCAVMVTNGGYGGVQMAVASGGGTGCSTTGA